MQFVIHSCSFSWQLLLQVENFWPFLYGFLYVSRLWSLDTRTRSEPSFVFALFIGNIGKSEEWGVWGAWGEAKVKGFSFGSGTGTFSSFVYLLLALCCDTADCWYRFTCSISFHHYSLFSDKSNSLRVITSVESDFI